VTAEVSPYYVARRSSIIATLNFIIPGDKLIGALRIEAQISPPGSPALSVSIDVTITLQQTLELRGIMIGYNGPDPSNPGQNLVIAPPTLADLQSTAAWALLAYPVQSASVFEVASTITATSPLTGTASKGVLHTRLVQSEQRRSALLDRQRRRDAFTRPVHSATASSVESQQRRSDSPRKGLRIKDGAHSQRCKGYLLPGRVPWDVRDNQDEVNADLLAFLKSQFLHRSEPTEIATMTPLIQRAVRIERGRKGTEGADRPQNGRETSVQHHRAGKHDDEDNLNATATAAFHSPDCHPKGSCGGGSLEYVKPRTGCARLQPREPVAQSD